MGELITFLLVPGEYLLASTELCQNICLSRFKGGDLFAAAADVVATRSDLTEHTGLLHKHPLEDFVARPCLGCVQFRWKRAHSYT